MAQITNQVQAEKIRNQIKKNSKWAVYSNTDETIFIAIQPAAVKYTYGASLRADGLYFSDPDWRSLFFRNIVGGEALMQRTPRIMQYEIFNKLKIVGEYLCLLDIPVETFVEKAAHKNKKIIIRDNFANFITF
ncbi:hypothetical protein [Aeromonas allosaccharophila]|uniref:hypothetical protein n=1 Tax=Aeromonas allosaccharophila TaxID=656 RepID=UPI0036DCE8B2